MLLLLLHYLYLTTLVTCRSAAHKGGNKSEGWWFDSRYWSRVEVSSNKALASCMCNNNFPTGSLRDLKLKTAPLVARVFVMLHLYPVKFSEENWK